MGLIRKVGAATNLITDRKYKDDAIYDLSDEQLVAAYRSTKRAKAASATGVTLNGGISTANPFFMGPMVLNGYQFGVGYINRKRVKEEVRKRKARSPAFAAWFEQEAESKGTKDMLVGAGIKGAFTTASVGILGFDSVAENFTEVAEGGPPPQTYAEAEAAQQAEKAAGEEAKEAFNIEHPVLGAIDEARGEIVGSLSAPFVEEANEHAPGHEVTQETSWFDLAHQHDGGFSAGTLAGQVVGVGFASEALQVPILAGEAAVDQNLKEKQEKEAAQSRTGTTG